MRDSDAVLIATPDMTHPRILMAAWQVVKRRGAETVAIEKPAIESHMANFLRCVRNRRTPHSSVDKRFHHAVAGCMAAVSPET